MNQLLANPAVQTALVLVIVTALNALVAWLKRKFPTQAASVEANWCYLQPVVEAAMKEAQAVMLNPNAVTFPAGPIVLKALSAFADSYRKLEGKDATAAEIEAARNEIFDAVSRVTGG